MRIDVLVCIGVYVFVSVRPLLSLLSVDSPVNCKNVPLGRNNKCIDHGIYYEKELLLLDAE